MSRIIITSKNAVLGHDQFIGEVLDSETCDASIEQVVEVMVYQGSTNIEWYTTYAAAPSKTLARAAAVRRNARP